MLSLLQVQQSLFKSDLTNSSAPRCLCNFANRFSKSNHIRRNTCKQKSLYSWALDMFQFREKTLEYIYLIQERTFFNDSKPIFKHTDMKMYLAYPKNTVFISFNACADCDKIEKILLCEFKKKYKKKDCFDEGYFLGDCHAMVKHAFAIKHQKALRMS